MSYLLAGAGGGQRLRQLPGSPPARGDARRGGAAVGQERGGEADIVLGRAVDLRRARHAWQGVELSGQDLGVTADPQRPLGRRLGGPHCAAVLQLLTHPLAHKVLREATYEYCSQDKTD